MKKIAIINKAVGQTPLSAMEAWRTQEEIASDVPLTYAGRLDPMAEGKLLILAGEECKKKDQYLALEKEYEFEVLFGVGSDTQDVLGRLSESDPVLFDERVIKNVLRDLTGVIELPYPHFSSKTIQGKPLHTWTLEGRLDEIEIPTKTSTIHTLELIKSKAVTRQDVYRYATEKIETIPPVTETSKALGNDFRRVDVRKDWEAFLSEGAADDLFYIARIKCIATSGTYMRSLSSLIASHLDTVGLAYSIRRTKIGRYVRLPYLKGMWLTQY